MSLNEFNIFFSILEVKSEIKFFFFTTEQQGGVVRRVGEQVELIEDGLARRTKGLLGNTDPTRKKMAQRKKARHSQYRSLRWKLTTRICGNDGREDVLC